jgi:hypothetical protein
MLHGLVKDSAVVGTYKRIKHSGRKRGRSTTHESGAEMVELAEGLAQGFSEMAETISVIKKLFTEKK